MRIETYLRKNYPVIWRTGVVKALVAGVASTALLMILARWLNQDVNLDDLLIAHVDKIQNAKYLLDIVLLGGIVFWLVRVKRFQLYEVTLPLITRSFLLFFPVCVVLFFGPLQAQVYAVEAVSKLVPGAVDAVKAYRQAESLLLRGGSYSRDFENELTRLLGHDVELQEIRGFDLARRFELQGLREIRRSEKVNSYRIKSLDREIRFELFDYYSDAWIEGSRRSQEDYKVSIIVEPGQDLWKSRNLGAYEVLMTLARAYDYFNGNGFAISAGSSLLLAVLSAVALCAASFSTVSGRVRFLSPINLVKTRFYRWFEPLEHYFSRKHPLFWLLGAHRGLVEFVFSLLFVVPAILVMIAVIDPLWENQIETIYYVSVFLLIPVLYLWDWFSRQSNIFQIYNGWSGTLRMLLAAVLLVSPIMILTLLVMVLAHLLVIPEHDPMFGASMSEKDTLMTLTVAVGLCGWAAPLLVMATQNIRFLRAVYFLSAVVFLAFFALVASFERDLASLICLVIFAGSLFFLLLPARRSGQIGKSFMAFASSVVLLNVLASWQFLDLPRIDDEEIFWVLLAGFGFVAIYVNQINRINLAPSEVG